MLDIQFIRDNQAKVQAAAAAKGADVDIAELLKADEHRRQLTVEVDDLRSQRNQLAEVGKKAKPTPEQIAQGKQLKTQLTELEEQLRTVNEAYRDRLDMVPNIPSDDTPVGTSEDQNEIIKTWGEKPQFDFQPKPHWEMSQFIDEERAVRLSGSRFTFIKGGLVRLQLALMQFGFDVLGNERTLGLIAEQAGLAVSPKPFLPMLPPAMMRTAAYKATGRLKPGEVTFKLHNDDLWLTGSSEHTLCAYHMGETIDEHDLPLRYVGYNTAFRREVGSAGQDTRGIIRQHQFDKLEMESFTAPEHSRLEHEFMIAIQEHLMQQLQMPYQLVLKCTFDMGGPNARGVDVETWMAGQGVYRETHTADYMTDYQARGLNTRLRRADGGKELVHTNDATAFSQRPLIAILENNQTADGKVMVPEVLRPYMGGAELIE